MAATVVDAFVNMLFSTDSKAAAQKQKMMEELARRKAEAERQHRIEEALRLEAISNRLAATLKLNGLPGLRLKDAGSSSAGLRLKLGDNGDGHAGIKGLPGIALNDTSGNGGSTPYGVNGLPGIYTNGPGSASSSSSSGGSGLKLKVGEESIPPAKVPATALPPGPTDTILPPSLADGIRDPQEMTPQQLADAATLVSSLPPEEQQRLIDAGKANAQSANAGGPTASQLQQVANASQSAAKTAGLDEAAAKARVGFDLPADAATLPTPASTGATVSRPAPAPAKQTGRGPSGGPQLPVDATYHDPAKPATVALLPPTRPEPEPGSGGKPAVDPCVPGVQKIIASREQLLTELAVRRSQLDSLKNTITRLNRTIQLDQRQFAVWQDEAQAGYDRVVQTAVSLPTQLALETLAERKEEHYKKLKEENKLTALDKDQMRKLDRLREIRSFDDFRKWVTEEKTDREMILQGFQTLLSLGLGPVPLSYVRCVQDSVDLTYDLTDLVATWDNVRQLDRNSTQFLQAVRSNGERMKMLVGRIQEIETRLNATPEGQPGPSPCREITTVKALCEARESACCS